MEQLNRRATLRIILRHFFLLRPQDRGKSRDVSRPQAFNFSAVCSHHDGCAERVDAQDEVLVLRGSVEKLFTSLTPKRNYYICDLNFQ